MIKNTLQLVAESIEGELYIYKDGYLIETKLKEDHSFTARFYYSLDGSLEKTTLI